MNNDYNKIINFANQQFTDENRNIDFLKIQPKIYKHPNLFVKHHFTTEENGEIKGLIGTYPIDYDNLKLLGIGTVCVNYQSRGQGIMGKMFKQLHKEVEPQYDLIYLSGDKTRYEHFGFYKTGRFVRFRIKSSRFKNKKFIIQNITPYLEDNQIINHQLYQLYKLKSPSFKRNADIYYDILRTHMAEIYLLEEEGIQGYIVYNPLRNVISEIVLDNKLFEDVIISFIQYKQLEEVYYEVSLDDENLPTLYELSEESYISTLMNFKVINYVNVIKYLLSKKKNLLPGKLSVNIDNKKFISITVSNTVSVEVEKPMVTDLKVTTKEMHTLLFDDFSLFYPSVSEKAGLLQSWFPLSLPVTLRNIDSI